MAAPLKASLPLALDLSGGYTFRFSAIDPTSGADIANVNVEAVSIMCDQLAGPPIASVEPPLLAHEPGGSNVPAPQNPGTNP